MSKKEERTSLGPLIRKHRLKRSLSLRELAVRCGVTASFLSQVENSKCQISVNSLRDVATALEVPIHSLLYGEDQDTKQDPGNKEIFFVSQDSSPTIHLPERNILSQLRTPNLGEGLEVLYSKGYRSSGNTARRLNISKQEVIFITSGQVRVILEQKEYILQAHDSIYFRDLELEVFECISEEASWLSIIARS